MSYQPTIQIGHSCSLLRSLIWLPPPLFLWGYLIGIWVITGMYRTWKFVWDWSSRQVLSGAHGANIGAHNSKKSFHTKQHFTKTNTFQNLVFLYHFEYASKIYSLFALDLWRWLDFTCLCCNCKYWMRLSLVLIV